MQAHYLNAELQNEFIDLCAEHVHRLILNEWENAKYFSVMVDATPDASHTEQTTFIPRYLSQDQSGFTCQECFLPFVDCCEKTGAQIASMTLKTLEGNNIPLPDCQGQGYDNGTNIGGKYNGAQEHIIENNSLCVFLPCGCHTLDLSGADSVACCPEAVTFFGTVQTIYNIFSSSPQQWSILQNKVGSSLHGLPGTRWTDHVDCVQPFAAHLPGIREALEQLLTLNLTPKTRNDVNGAIK